VSHDRAFLNNIVTSTFILDDNGHVNEYIGGYDDWHKLIQDSKPAAGVSKPAPTKQTSSKADAK
ncbi:MAG TPA: hypothetical protein DCX53_04550, partial [Anaerolineae bacterium]|nr:hypothetical protein [Anaerolineae bacterium]